MRRDMTAAGIVALLLGLATLTPLWGQQEEKAAAPAQAEKKKPNFRRLPNYYGQLALSGEQRDKVYAVQIEYGQKIYELRQQIEALEKQRDEANRNVLTSEQQAKFDDLLAKARARREARRRARGEQKPKDPSPDSP